MRKVINFGFGGILIAAVVTIIASVAFGLNPGYKSHTNGQSVNRSDACSMSQEFVKQTLKAPRTAVFPMWTETNCRVSQRGRVWVVKSYVDSQNSFSAMLRSDYTAEMIYYPATDTWTLVDLTIVSR